MDTAARLDLPALRARASNDEALVREVIEDFLRDADELLSAVVAGVGGGRFGEAARDAHRIRGALLARGAGPAAVAASALEAAACSLVAVAEPTGAQKNDVCGLLEAFRGCLEEARAEMRSYVGESSPI